MSVFVCKCVCVCVRSHFKSSTHTKNRENKKNKQALNNTIAFPTMVSESGKLESTMMHTAHNGLTNRSFVSENTPLFYRFCHHSARKTHCDILCVAVICLASRVHTKSNIILKKYFFISFRCSYSAASYSKK